ncbi:MAG: HEPN domain-containing protein [Anaerolineae bacterium]|nr:HEPN domain-containing protein [Anaerolineae bacterium]MDW7991652.1 HEPN domain-containing protein [Anaerolineae bacterium]
MRRSPLEEGHRWLQQAYEDLRWARHLQEEGAFYLACFLAQQVAEKALKAFLYAQGEEVVLGHSVRRLAEEVAARNPHFAGMAARWGILDTYYIPTRYPNGLPDGIPAQVYTARVAEEAVALAQEVVETVAKHLSVSY